MLVHRTMAIAIIAAACAAASTSGANATVASRSQIAHVDENDRITLTGNTRPEAKAENDRGAVSSGLPMEHLFLQLKRSPEREASLKQTIDALYDRNSPNYHHWLTPQQFGASFGTEDQDIKTVSNWLASHGLHVNSVYSSRVLIDFSGTAGQIAEAFHTHIHYLRVNGETHIANMSDPQIPRALSSIIEGVGSLHDFHPHSFAKQRPNYTVSGCSGKCYLVVPADLATIYNMTPAFNSGVTGTGQTIAVVEDSDLYSTSDWTNFRSAFGLSSYTQGNLQQVHPVCADPGVTADDFEATIDAEYASAAAPNATIEVASCYGLFTFGGLIALEDLVNLSPPPVISVSYGECEALNGATSNAIYNSVYQQAAAEGVSVFVSSGDDGGTSCDRNVGKASHGIGVNGLASSPYDVAVGGTDFGDTYARQNSLYWSSTNSSAYGSALSYVPEIPWNNSCGSVLIATYVTGSGVTYGPSGFCNVSQGQKYLTTLSGSGGPSGCATGAPKNLGVVGGTCAGYAKPAWQNQIPGVPADGVRDLPDVSLFAANGIWSHYYVICFSDKSRSGKACTGAPSGWTGAGGTSFSAPIVAGIQALINQKADSWQGNPTPIYYAIASFQYGSSWASSCNSSNGNQVGSKCVFYDLTLGDINVDCSGTYNCYLPGGSTGVLSTSGGNYNPAWTTSTGWDAASGLGSINVSNLIKYWL